MDKTFMTKISDHLSGCLEAYAELAEKNVDLPDDVNADGQLLKEIAQRFIERLEKNS